MISSTAKTPSKRPKTAVDMPLVVSKGENSGFSTKVLSVWAEAINVLGEGTGVLTTSFVFACAIRPAGAPKSCTTKVVSIPPRSPSTTATPISSYLVDKTLSLCVGEAIQASTTDDGLAKSRAKFSPA
ncbi:MAG: hypothetical protein ACD_52C00226G0001 [uncultured bacterium]|nr:MAG: hypothetical protein ACD_52C00226G0001 [uncultured bacterium]